MKLRIEFDNSTEGGCEPEAVVDVVEVSSYRGDDVVDVDVWCDVIARATIVAPGGMDEILAALLMRVWVQEGFRGVASCLEPADCIMLGETLVRMGKEIMDAQESIFSQVSAAE